VNEWCTKVRTNHLLPKIFCESGHVDPHVECRYLLQSNEAVGYQIPRCPVVTGEPLEIGSGDLDKGLKKVSLLAVVSHRVPQSFEYLVTFPPIGEIVEVDPIEIVLRGLPLIGGERRWLWLWLTIGMAQGITSWMWCLARYETIGGERTG
jgi:hypothetical protein